MGLVDRIVGLIDKALGTDDKAIDAARFDAAMQRSQERRRAQYAAIEGSPWADELLAAMVATEQRARAEGRPSPYALEPPSPFFDLPISSLVKYGLVTPAQATEAMTKAMTPSPPEEWFNSFFVNAMDGRGYGDAEIVARIGLIYMTTSGPSKASPP